MLTLIFGQLERLNKRDDVKDETQRIYVVQDLAYVYGNREQLSLFNENYNSFFFFFLWLSYLPVYFLVSSMYQGLIIYNTIFWWSKVKWSSKYTCGKHAGAK